jgi:hypothetical protein
VSLVMYTVFPWFFSSFKIIMEVIFLNAVQYHLWSLWMPDIVSKHHPFSFIFNLGNKEKSQGAKSGE